MSFPGPRNAISDTTNLERMPPKIEHTLNWLRWENKTMTFRKLNQNRISCDTEILEKRSDLLITPDILAYIV